MTSAHLATAPMLAIILKCEAEGEKEIEKTARSLIDKAKTLDDKEYELYFEQLIVVFEDRVAIWNKYEVPELAELYTKLLEDTRKELFKRRTDSKL